MYLHPTITKQKIEENKDLLTFKESAKHPGLFVAKYKKKVFFDGLWNEFLEETRGLVVDENYQIVQRPFLKIYNYGVEKEAPIFEPDEEVHCYRKVNGFMVAASYHQGKLVVSTTGSLDSGFADLGRCWLQKCPNLLKDMKQCADFTFLFECCDTTDPHIVTEDPGLYLLGLRHKETGRLVINDQVLLEFTRNNPDCWVPQYQNIPFKDVLDQSRIVKHEGFVVYSSTPENHRSTKIKSPYYLTKKMLMRKNIEKLLTMDAKQILDEEFYPLVDYIREVDKDSFAVLDEQAKKEYIENFFRKA